MLQTLRFFSKIKDYLSTLKFRKYCVIIHNLMHFRQWFTCYMGHNENLAIGNEYIFT